MEKVVTVEILKEMGANCQEELTKFQELFPNGAEITLENCLKAVRDGLSIEWFFYRFLPDPIRQEYEKKTGPIWQEYREKVAPIFISVYEAHQKGG